MSKLIVPVFVLASFILSMTAFSQPDPAMMKERLSKNKVELMEKLALTDDQNSVVGEIIDSQIERRMKLMSERSPGMRAEMDKNDEETASKLQEVLDAEQMETYQKLQKEARENRQGRRPPPNASGNRIN